MDPGNVFLPFGKRNCGRTEPDATRKALSDAALRCDDCAVGDFNVTDNAHLARYRNTFAHSRATGDASLRHDHGIFSDHDVVRDLYEIVDLNALLDPCPAKPRAIHGGVCADLDVVVDLDNSELLNFLVAAIDDFETKAVSSDNSASVNNPARANLASLPNCHVGMNVARGPNHRFVSDVAPPANDRVVANFGTGFDAC